MAQNVAVDCRSKTCVVHIEYPSPADALENTRESFPVIDGCNGTSTTPTPPTDSGPYDLVAVYYCR